MLADFDLVLSHSCEKKPSSASHSATCKMFALLNRIYTAFSPPVAEKKPGAIKFGVLGAAGIT
jgi:hypothetical protein